MSTHRFSPEHFRGDLFDVAAVMTFARAYEWNTPIEDPETAAAAIVWQLEQDEPLHDDAKRLLHAALVASARAAQGKLPELTPELPQELKRRLIELLPIQPIPPIQPLPPLTPKQRENLRRFLDNAKARKAAL